MPLAAFFLNHRHHSCVLSRPVGLSLSFHAFSLPFQLKLSFESRTKEAESLRGELSRSREELKRLKRQHGEQNEVSERSTRLGRTIARVDDEPQRLSDDPEPAGIFFPVKRMARKVTTDFFGVRRARFRSMVVLLRCSLTSRCRAQRASEISRLLIRHVFVIAYCIGW